MARGIERRRIFLDDRDREDFLRRLSELATSTALEVYALSCLWVLYLGRSGRVLARELGVSPQAVYAASSRVRREIEIKPVDLERWCR